MFLGWKLTSKRTSQVTSIPKKNRNTLIEGIKSIFCGKSTWENYGKLIEDLVRCRCESIEDFFCIITYVVEVVEHKENDGKGDTKSNCEQSFEKKLFERIVSA